MSNKKLEASVSMAKRAGKLLLGFDVVKEAMEEKKLQIILLAKDVSPKTQKEVEFFAGKGNIKAYKIPVTMDELWYLVGKRSGVIGVSDIGFSSMIIRNLSLAETVE